MAIKSVKKANPFEAKKKEMPNLRSRSSIIALSVLLSLVVSAIAYWGFVGPQFHRVGEGRELDVVAAQSKLVSAQENLDQLNQLQQNYTSISEENIDRIARVLPQEEQIPEILAQLEAIARESGVSLVSVNVTEVQDQQTQSARQRLEAQQRGQQAAAKSGIQKLSIRVDVSAFSYPRFRSFLDALQSHIRLFDVQMFNFSTENQFHSVTVQTYYISS